MIYRPLGRSGLLLSAVGFGTCQLRSVTRQQAVKTLIRGFERGVNLVHTAPDYEGADDVIAEAVHQFGGNIIVASQCHGDAAHVEWLFESTCRRFRTDRLPLYGISCIDDREYLGENVWGPGGMVEYLLRKKHEGRIGAIFCTTHGKPEYIQGLVRSGVFDGIMLAYNPLGFHLLSYYPAGARELESLPGNQEQVFPLAIQLGVGLMIMKPLAGGILARSKAFPRRGDLFSSSPSLTAPEILRSILRLPGITCTVVGTASPEEAEENAGAGDSPLELPASSLGRIDEATAELRSRLCSRCGRCDEVCSRHLPVSWLFRDAFVTNYPGEAFETVDELRYFHLHSGDEAGCSVCTDITCSCPAGIDIPRSLIQIHSRMLQWRDEGLLAASPAQIPVQFHDGFPLRLIRRELPRALALGERGTGTLWIENAGTATWKADIGEAAVALSIQRNGTGSTRVPVRHDVEPGERTHFVFDIGGHENPGNYTYSFVLTSTDSSGLAGTATEILRHELRVDDIRA